MKPQLEMWAALSIVVILVALFVTVLWPFANGALILGTWQQIVLIDFDNRARTRRVVVQVMGQ